MSSYVPSWEYKTTFQGDEIRVTLKPLSRMTALRFASLDVEDGIGRGAMALYEDAVRESVQAFAGLKDANGQDVALDQVLRDAYFTELVFDLGAELVRKASPANPA